MRSQKQVRHVGKIRSLKNAAAGKWKTYRRRLEARKAWQNNAILTGHQHSSKTLAPPPPTHRKIKVPKQRSPEELAERQRLREQRRLEKKLAKQRASTSTLPETRKEKKLKEVSSNGSPKKASTEQKTAAKTIKAKNPMTEETTKAKRLMNEQAQRTINVAKQEIVAKKVNELKAMKVPKLHNESKPKHQYLKEERRMSAEEQEIGRSSCPVKLEQKALVQSKKRITGVNKTGKKSSEKKGQIEEIIKKAKDDEVQLPVPVQMIESQEPIVPTVLHSGSKEIGQDHLVDSDVVSSAKVGTAREFLEEKALIANEDEQNEVYASRGKAEGICKEHKKEKRIRRSDPNNLLSEHDFVEEDTHEMDYEEEKADFTEIIGRRQKKKGRHRDEQQLKPEECTGKTRNENEKVTQATSVVKSGDQFKKQEEDISEKKENKGLNESMAHLTKDQSCALESAGFKTEEIMDHITFCGGKISKDSGTLSTTEMIMKASILEELEMNMARLAKEHPEPSGATNLISSGNVTGNLAVTNCAKEAKYDVGVEKKEPVVLASPADGISRVPAARERVCKLLPRDIQFCVRMIEKHGEDYEAMAKDQGNIFRDSAKGIARKIRIFKESPQYEAYLKQKAEENGSVA